jgi:hypothetical protein
MKPSLVLSASFVVVAVTAAPALAQIPILENLVLRGNYAVTGTAICNQLNGAVSVVTTLTTSGTYTFNGDGTGSATETALTSVQGAIGSTGSNNHTFTFKYAVNGEGRFTLTTDPGSFTGTIVSGPNAGLTFSVDQLAPITGSIGEPLAEILSGATLESPIETTTLSNGIVSTRRCQRSPVFLKL